MSKIDMANHVRRLCEQHNIETLLRSSPGGRAWAKKRKIHIKPVKTQTTYIIALHEIAHIVYPPARHGNRLLKEANAWKWTIEHSIVKLKPATYAKVQRYLGSYLAKANRSKNMKIPKTEDSFWDFYNALIFKARKV
jgi:hypothetical protein